MSYAIEYRVSGASTWQRHPAVFSDRAVAQRCADLNKLALETVTILRADVRVVSTTAKEG
jgi:hypothetical protein